MTARPTHLRLVPSTSVVSTSEVDESTIEWPLSAVVGGNSSMSSARREVLEAAVRDVLAATVDSEKAPRSSARLLDLRHALGEDLAALRRAHRFAFPGASLVTPSSESVQGATFLVRAQLALASAESSRLTNVPVRPRVAPARPARSTMGLRGRLRRMAFELLRFFGVLAPVRRLP
jgi:hypothetical protein